MHKYYKSKLMVLIIIEQRNILLQYICYYYYILVWLKMAEEAPLYISSCAIKELVSMKDVVDVMQDALRWFSERDQVVQPVRTVVPIEQHAG